MNKACKLVSGFCSCAICLLTNVQNFSFSVNMFLEGQKTLRRKKIYSWMFSDTCADQLAVFSYSQFNVRSSATMFMTRTLVKLRQIFIVFAVSLSGQKIKFLIIIIPAVYKSCFKLSLLTSYFFCFFRPIFFPRERFNELRLPCSSW